MGPLLALQGVMQEVIRKINIDRLKEQKKEALKKVDEAARSRLRICGKLRRTFIQPPGTRRRGISCGFAEIDTLSSILAR